MSVYIGIDWSEKKHDVCFMNESGEVIIQIKIPHSPEGYFQFDQARQKLSIQPEDCIIGIETSHNPLLDYLIDLNYSHIHILNPIAVHAAQKIFRPSGAKDDIADCWLMAELLRRDHGKFPEWIPDSILTRQIKAHISMLSLLKKQSIQTENRLRSTLLRYYPAAIEIFSSVSCLVTLEWIKAYPTPEKASQVSWDTFQTFLKDHRHPKPAYWPKCYSRLKMSYVRAAPEIVAIYSQEAVTLAELLLKMLSSYKTILTSVTKHYQLHPDAPIYDSLPGVGVYLGPALLAKLGDNRLRFPSPQIVQAIAGTCPITKQSGKSHIVNFRRVCDREFRQIVQQWAISSVKSSPWAATYFFAARPHAVSDNEAYRKLANRWLEVLWRIWRDRVPYDEQIHLHNNTIRSAPKA